MRGQANLPAAAHGRCLALRSITANGAPGGVQFVHYHLRTVAPVVRADAGFEDEEIQVGVAPFPHQLALTVRNKSARPLRLRWEDLVYVAPDGQAERLVAWPARKAPPDTAALVPPEVPALVPPGAELRIKVAPDRPKVLGHGGTLGDGPTVLPQGPGVEHLVGKEIGLYLPIELGDTPRPLHLRLRIERISWDDAKIYWLP